MPRNARADAVLTFLREARRRKVYVTVAGYVALALVMKEVAELVITATRAPAVTMQIATILLLLGFPVVVVLAWLFDITSEGVRRTEPMPVAHSKADTTLAAAPLPRMTSRSRSRPPAAATPEVVAPLDPLRVKRATLGHMRHELRTPINGILGYAEMLLEDEPAPELSADLERIRAAGRRLLVLIDEILSPERLVNDGEVRTLESFGAQVAADLRTPTSSVIGYSEMLIENAKEAGNDIIVPDLERILTSARRLLELSGDITAVATGGEPAHASDAALTASSRLTESVLVKMGPSGSGLAAAEGEGTVLIVDDNSVNRDLLSRQLARRGYIVETAADGVAALEKLAEREFDVVLLDVIMPRMDGVETLQRIRADARLEDLPVLMLSSIDEVDSAIRCIELGAEEYLQKPAQATLLETRVAANVTLRRMRAREHVYEAQLGAARERLARLAHAAFPVRIATRVLHGELAIEETFAEATVVACMLPRDMRGAGGGRDLLPRLRALSEVAEKVGSEQGAYARVARTFGILLLSPALQAGDNHAERAAAAAAAMARSAAETGVPFSIALHTGPLLAGVIGKEGLRYEAWGDAADTAEALTLHCAPGKIVVSPTTYALLRDRFQMDAQGLAAVAGRGQMKLYQLPIEVQALTPGA
ncbi:MAG: response regulator [Gemmatimonadetes bacterium]|nr:response regulator [Gemmatimonadota bacterium]